MSNLEHLSDRAVIRITGEDTRSFLQGLISQDIDLLTPTQPIFACLLTPQGKILFDFFIIERGDALLIDCDKTAMPLLAKRLTLYKLRAKVSIDIDDSLQVLASEQEPEASIEASYLDPRHANLGWRSISDTPSHASVEDDYNQRRITLGVPEFGKDFGADEMFLLDVNYDTLNAVSYKKGCFVGQEVTSRMKRKSEARKRTCIVEFDSEAPLPKGTPLTAGNSTLGETLSSTDTKALAMIRVDRWEKAKAAGASLTCTIKGAKDNVSNLRLTLPDTLKQD